MGMFSPFKRSDAGSNPVGSTNDERDMVQWFRTLA